jgi:hypothetical protein
VPATSPAYVHMYDVLEGIKDGGTFLLELQLSPRR